MEAKKQIETLERDMRHLKANQVKFYESPVNNVTIAI